MDLNPQLNISMHSDLYHFVISVTKDGCRGSLTARSCLRSFWCRIPLSSRFPLYFECLAETKGRPGKLSVK